MRLHFVPCRLVACAAIAGITCCLTPVRAAEPITIDSLLRQMVDMDRLTVLPDPWNDSDQQSSYDRASVAPDQDGWFANGDAGQFIRQEDNAGRTEYVMAEMEGPGAIVRLWSANPDGGGTIRIYLDDNPVPALEADFLALTSAAMPEFPAPFSGRRSLGANLYFPIPYQTRCKVTVDRPNLYYHVGYRTYPPGTQVEPFSMAALPGLRPVMEEVAAILAAPEQPVAAADATRYDATLTLAPGEVARVWRFSGPIAIKRLECKLDVPADQLVAALRETLLTINFDDEDSPSVLSPLGDFFGSTPGLNPFRSLPNGMLEDGSCYSNWVMPCATSAEVRLHNESAFPVTVVLSAWTQGIRWQEGRSMHFHAKWRNEWLPADPPFVDWPMLEATGPGRFVGVMLGVMNTHPGWWGEGDEKIWVDDDTFPSFFGTGSEDYFGYAWCNPALFTHAYHNQSIVTGPGNFGYTAVARYHILDDIPFRQRIRFFIEKWAGADREYCCTAYWYAVPGATDFFTSVPVEQRRVRPLPERYKVKGALEGESLRVVRCTGGETQLQDLPPGPGGEFSEGKHLWWLYGPEGSVLEVAVPVHTAGRYEVTVGLTQSWDYGIHQLMVNGVDVGEPVDLYNPQITPLKLNLGVFDLPAADMLLGLRCVGTNPNARPVNHMAGLDYVLLTPVE